ncbi:MAG: hypothetical protein A2806_03435 [Candidatus Terrybacteria bacterium RIFCSPHIGHO2_01_FULL_48_17]|uniref:Uncharacterized protein n=1 Tax=Candidatus Terrybacteria bacterium RIFCSPHIGHO2_01_FULL_48_17 TaxID=1802362 RepID=A0A1G2PH95_9BACT|nr:MAG: hypothetical protein A2806_03435 [Candidatus Terrybacteria bacterium RIFCSPHIGHO2_01_FULL_48_17]OHA53122.1 MAG: hypothetical protein A3A30_02025 [Candidatus Terrybacteria bacterium RIFCSPLOWO2_01_FULL_48_14]
MKGEMVATAILLIAWGLGWAAGGVLSFWLVVTSIFEESWSLGGLFAGVGLGLCASGTVFLIIGIREGLWAFRK